MSTQPTFMQVKKIGCPTPKLRLNHGISLIETLIVVVLLATIASIAAPNFQKSIQNYRVATAAESMRDAVMIARTEAIRRGAQVFLEPNCATGEWTCGWKVVPASDTDNPVRLGDMPSTINVTFNGSENRVTFNPNGSFTPNNTQFIFRVQGNTNEGRALALDRGLRICRIQTGTTCID